MTANKQLITITKDRKFPAGFPRAVFFVACLLVLFFNRTVAAEPVSIGPIFDRFRLTLDDGYRSEAAGPFYYSQQKETETTWALPPLFSSDRDPAVESEEQDFLYPIATHIRYGHESRWQFFQVLSTSGGQEPSGVEKRRFTIFPLYFQQRSADTNLNYTAVVPFYGHLKNRLYHDEIFFCAFPFYSETRKRDVVIDNYFYPFVDVRHGDGMTGWQVWPFVGHAHKIPTLHTNDFGDVETIGGYDHFFWLWPFHLKQDNGIGTADPEKFRASLPFYVYSRSPKLDSTTVLWPFFTWMDNREKKYREWQMPWPVVVYARGAGKTTSRVFPFFQASHNAVKESDFYLWPVWQFRRTHADPLDQKRTQVLFYLYARLSEKNTQTGEEKVRLDMWPFFEWHHDFDGRARLQIIAPLEPLVPDNRGVERNWSPLWSLWRAEANPRTGASSQSLLWNLYRHETAPGHRKISLLFGLFQQQRDNGESRTRLFYIPIFHSHKS